MLFITITKISAAQWSVPRNTVYVVTDLRRHCWIEEKIAVWEERERDEWWREELAQPSPLHDTHPSTIVTGAHQSHSQQRQMDWFEVCTHHNKRSLCACAWKGVKDVRGLVYLPSVPSSKDAGESSIVDPEFSGYLFKLSEATSKMGAHGEYRDTCAHTVS